MLYILAISFLPSLILMGYIYKLDRVEREPAALIKRLFLAGMLSTLFAMILELVGSTVLTFITRIRPMDETGILYNFLFFFCVVGVSEEAVKLFPVVRNTWYSEHFDCRFDGVVYAAATALGFAAAENIVYVLDFGISVAHIRAVTAIPMHGICGIFMGHHYGEAKMAEYRHDWGRYRLHRILTFLVPVVLHGYYDFCQSVDNAVLAGSFFLFVVILDVFAFISLKRYANDDRYFRSDNIHSDIFRDYR